MVWVAAMETQEDLVLYPLQPKQEEFWLAAAIYRVIGWAKGWGKSYGCRAEAFIQCMSRPMIKWLAIRKTRPEIIKNFAEPMQRELLGKTGGKKLMHLSLWNNQIKFFNGSTIDLGYCRNEKDVTNYQGLEYDFICIEELTQRKEKEFRMLMNCLRSVTPGITPNFFWSTNPWGIGHNRVKRIRLDRDFKEWEVPSDYQLISANVYDNPILLKNQPRYLDNLRALPDKLREAYLKGNRDVFDGQYFDEFNRDIHVISPYIPKHWVKRRIACLDYWYTNPSAVYRIALMNNGKVIVYRELYVTGHTVKQLALRVKAMTPPDEKVSVLIYDPALNKKWEDSGIKLSDYLKLTGIKIKPGNNSRIAWRNVMRDCIEPYKDPNTKSVTALLQITSNCVNLIKTLPTQIHDSVNVEDLDTTLEDHGPDALRYGLMELGIKKTWFKDVADLNAEFTKNALEKANEMGWKEQTIRVQTKGTDAVLGMDF